MFKITAIVQKLLPRDFFTASIVELQLISGVNVALPKFARLSSSGKPDRNKLFSSSLSSLAQLYRNTCLQFADVVYLKFFVMKSRSKISFIYKYLIAPFP